MQIPEELLKKLSNLDTPTVIAVSGFGGSGKSSFAKSLGEAINVPVVGVDSFQKVGAFDTKYKLWEIMDFARLEEEVLVPFISNQPTIKYGNFDAGIEKISEIKEVKNSGIIIIEGVGLFRPELMKYFTYKIWVDCPIDVAIERGKKRDREEYGNPTDELWDGIWKENDLQYLQTFTPKTKADFVINNSNTQLNQSLINKYVNELNKRNYSILDELIADEVIVGSEEITREQYKQQIKDRIEKYPDYFVKINNTEIKEETIILHWHRTGTNKETGEQLDEELTSEYKISNDKIVEVH